MKKISLKKLKLIVMIILFLAWLMMLFSIITNYQQKMMSYMRLETDSFQAKLDSTLRSYERFADYLYHSVVEGNDIPALMYEVKYANEDRIDELRNEAYLRLESTYEIMETYHFRQLHLHTTEGVSFLRMHMPDKYKDSLMDVRDSIRIANVDKIYVTGFEEGRIFNGYRYVFPLFYDNEHVGSSEVSVSISSTFSSLSNLYPKLWMNFVIDKQVVMDTVWDDQQNNYSESMWLDGYLVDNQIQDLVKEFEFIDKETIDYLIKAVVNENQNEYSNKTSFSSLVSYQDKDYLVTFLTIKNIATKPVAYFIGVSENNMYSSLYDDLIKDVIAITALFVLLMMLLYSRLTKQEILENISTKDSLTDLYNRRKFYESIEAKLKKANRGALIILDIDYFKKINDQYGHNVGDDVLKLLARKLLSNIRENDIVARWGGEEFLIFLSGSDIINATKIAERIRLAVSETDFTIKDQVTISLGVAMIQNYDQINDAIKAADDALYKAKSTGRNKVEVNIST